MHRLLLVVIILITLSHCGKNLPVLNGIDLAGWKDDRNGCGGKRLAMETAMRSEHDKLKGLSEMDIVQLLGKPDQNELYKRNQKFFYYSISRAAACPVADSTRVSLVIRFNAMGYAQLTSVE